MSRTIIFLAVFLIAFPFRRAFLRHWRVTIPASIGAICGHFMARLAGQYGDVPAFVDLMWTIIGAGFFAYKGKDYLDRLFPPK